MTLIPTLSDKIDDKLLSISSLIRSAQEKIDKGHYVKAKEYLERSLKITEELRKMIKNFFEIECVNEKDIWRE